MTTLEEEVTRLRAENARLKEPKALSLKVSEKGACSLYGLGRFPVTLYKEQWERLLGHAEKISAFLADNADELKTKE